MMIFLTTNWLIFSLVFLHLAVITFLIPKILLQRRESGASIAWILVIVFLPFFGMLAFWLLGTTRIRMFRRKRHRAEQHLVPSLARFRRQQKLSDTDDIVASSLYSLAAKLDDCGPQPGCEVEMYRDGSKAFDALEHAIDAAQEHIHLTYYIWEMDTTGSRFCQALTRAAERGVEIRLLLDDVGCYATKTSFFTSLIAAGGEVSRFLPLNLFSRQVSVNHRNHRKIVIIDGKLGFTGSMNIGDTYLGLGGRWNDLHLCVSGRVVYELQGVFCQDWFYATGKDVAIKKYFPDIRCHGAICAQFLASGPADERWRTIHTLLFVAINTAMERVWIETPYFVPDPPIVMALQTAALRGVDVRLLLPGHSDHFLVDYAGRSFFDELLNAGVRIFKMDNIIPHAKTAVVDQVFSTAGSANMDQRSFRLNFEGNLFFFGKEIAAKLEKDFLYMSQFAHEVTSERRRQLTHMQRLKEGFARILAPLL
ncbi:cardiolipin synthase [Desulfuromusa kysingii]|uniref:Cardiolipin synthase n=1 Tax=Desulfuromusa kysingii TaxID=37625 RepID=A0A1H4E5N4_9BACT|nr:cardiolipin synthase [Desulfuromusa kysingii]SEA79682.1 cardiolipin synthase [Desulfuromusa kysingii]